jgi:2-oxoglutarate ferredoxin oxidoreductase subunit delta
VNTVKIDFERCKQCKFCIKFCSKQILKQGEDLNKQGYYPPYVTEPEKCIACGICARVCPEAAIEVYKDE